jgi:hypothetical protein
MKESDEETGRGWKRKKGEKSLREVGYLSVSPLKQGSLVAITTGI